MNTKASVYSKTAAIATCLLALFTTVIRCMLMSTYDAASGFYTNDTLQMLFVYPAIAFAAVMFVLPYIYIKEGNSPTKLPESKAVKVVSIICACVFGGFIAYTFAKLVLPTVASPAPAELLTALFALVALLYFVSGSSKLGDARAILACGSALVLLAIIFSLYFSTSVSYVNHSVKHLYAAAIFTMLATVAEANSILKRPCLRRYLSYAPSAIALSFSLAIPDIIYIIGGSKAPVTDIYFDFIVLAMGVYHLARLITLALTKPIED